MNVIKLNEILTNNDEALYSIIESLGFDSIRERHGSSGGYFVFPNLNGDNKGAINIYKESLNYNNYTRGHKGNIYTLIMEVKKISFPKALDYVVKVLKLDKSELESNINYPFGGFYLDIIKSIQEPELSMKTYDLNLLDEYANKYSRLFFEDGISYNSQQKYNVGYDIWSNRITIPEFTFDGKLCGIMGRLNERDCSHEDRWLPIIPCSRNLTLYGYLNNYHKIKQKDLCIIEESEKGVMQMNSMRCGIGLATCGDNISPTQQKYIKALNTSRIILAYDEGLDEDYIRSEAEKLKVDNCILKNRVGYIYDKNHDIMIKGAKQSPSDLGIKGFTDLMKNYVTWVS